MVIDHKPNGRNSDREFTASLPMARPPSSASNPLFEAGLLISPNGIAAVAPDHFYVTNDHATTGALGRFAEDYLLWPHADVLLSAAAAFASPPSASPFPAAFWSRTAFSMSPPPMNGG